LRTIAILAQKGGAGKTSLSLALAVEADARGLATAVLDLDPQATAAAWGDQRGGEHPAVAAVPAARLEATLKAAADNGAALAIIDTPPQVEGPALAAARAAEFVLIPSKPNIFDIRAIQASVEIAKLAGKPAAVVLIGAHPSAKRRVDEARAVLEQMGANVAPVSFAHRAAWPESAERGKTPTETEPDGAAAGEIRAFWDWLDATYQLTARGLARMTA